MIHRLRVIDSHTGGEPTRTVISGGPDLGDGTVAEQCERLKDNFDCYRTALINEPRGSDVLVGALLCRPSAPECAAGVIFFNNAGYLGMCGHGTIGLVVTLQHCGLLSAGECRIETPVGIVSAVLNKDGSVSVDNVPAYRRTANMAVYLPEAGKTVHGDLAWGGNWFFICADHGQKLTLDNIPALTRLSRDIRRALNAMGCPEVDHIELTGPAHDKTAHGRNFVLCPGGAYDRSPCGTGTSAKVACLAAEGKLNAEEIWIQESITGSFFQASYRPHPQNNGHILPRIRGTAFVTAACEFILNEADPLCWGMPPANLNLSPV